jgi:hypothetical protein
MKDVNIIAASVPGGRLPGDSPVIRDSGPCRNRVCLPISLFEDGALMS